MARSSRSRGNNRHPRWRRVTRIVIAVSISITVLLQLTFVGWIVYSVTHLQLGGPAAADIVLFKQGRPAQQPLPPEADIPPVGQFPDGRSWFLAMGDSVPRGYTHDPSRTGINSAWPVELQLQLAADGYPMTFYDTACAGETIETFRSHCPRTDLTPLLADQSQETAALAAIRAQPNSLRFMVLEVGSNDLSILKRQPGDGNDLEYVKRVITDAHQSLDRIREIITDFQQAAPGVPLVVVDLFNPCVSVTTPCVGDGQMPTPEIMGIALAAVDQELDTAITQLGAYPAEVGAAFNGPHFDQDPCASGLVDTCRDGDFHPTIKGQRAIAQAVYLALPQHAVLGRQTPAQAARQ